MAHNVNISNDHDSNYIETLNHQDNLNKKQDSNNNLFGNSSKVIDDNSFCIDTSGLIPSKKSVKQEEQETLPSLTKPKAHKTNDVNNNSISMTNTLPKTHMIASSNYLLQQRPHHLENSGNSILQERPRNDFEYSDDCLLQERPRPNFENSDGYLLQERPRPNFENSDGYLYKNVHALILKILATEFYRNVHVLILKL